MKCEKCGIEYEGEFCPQCSTQQEKPKKQKKPVVKKWWFWVLMGLATVVTVAAVSGGEDAESTENQGQTQNSSVVSTVSKEEDNIYNVGDIINANGLKITYVSAENYTEENMFMQPEDGNKYIRIKISAENTSSVDRYISYLDFTCYCDGAKAENFYTGDKILTGGTLSSGRKTDGYVYFEIPENAKEVEVEYETSFWTDKKAILKVDL